MRKTILTYGLISGGIAALLMFITVLFVSDKEDFSSGVYVGYAGIILSFVLVYFGIKSYRDKYRNGIISFGKAFQVGILIAAISSLIYVIAWMSYSPYLMPDFPQKYAKAQIENAKEAGKSEAEVAQVEEEMQKYLESIENPLIYGLMTFAEPFPVGLIITLISSMILKRKTNIGATD
ncbi:MAG TPA: DUF4199 domain-containing protein [Chitinophagales bacterium]|nr:DUF4199 domain-containing protein [Chitinophagales bacterium]HRG86566.1 DUF4199 domain-containing protein [Chitinophagales bacterium]HRH52805.1 DUF4199 domain-containing protein [Chitinophagales bacterium]